MAGIAVRGGNNAFGEPHRTILSFRNLGRASAARGTTLPGACERAVSRDGLWSPDRGDSFAKIHNGLVADDSGVAASDGYSVNALAVPIGGENFGFRIADRGMAAELADLTSNLQSAVRNPKFSFPSKRVKRVVVITNSVLALDEADWSPQRKQGS
jgi:hypothetical protein